MPEILIEDLAHDRGLVLNINGRTPNFTLRTEAIPHAAMHELEPAARDFLEIAAAVFYADGQFGRGGPMRSGMGRDWRRNFRITMNVRRLDLWQRPDVIEALTETIRFLTEDQVEFRFAQWTEWERLESFLDLDPAGNALAANEVILLSGGLDSFAGALEALNTGSGKVLLVSHRSAPKVHHRQDELASWLIERFPERVRHIGVSALRTGSEPRETTQRSRSLLFTAIGHAVAQAFGGKRLSFYENGVVSHNLPISPQVVGTMATRTVDFHPELSRLGA